MIITRNLYKKELSHKLQNFQMELERFHKEIHNDLISDKNFSDLTMIWQMYALAKDKLTSALTGLDKNF